MSLDSAEARKARGAFFTPPALCSYVVDWAIRSSGDDVLEPSCGEAAFLLAAGERLAALRSADDAPSGGSLSGAELHEHSARQAHAFLAEAGYEAKIATGDFFLVAPSPSYDVVIGNPPYVRYQDFAGESRTRSREAALRAGVPLTGLASSWAAFTVHSALFLRPGGRLGLVLPAELLTVNYAAEVRRFLMERFERVRLVLFKERVFPGVLEEVVLLLADGYEQGPAKHCELHQVVNVEDLVSASGVGTFWKPDPVEGKWTPSLLSTAALESYVEIEGSEGFDTLHAWGETTLGMVTGNNRYFALSPTRAKELLLKSQDLIALSPPGSKHLRGLTFSAAAYRAMGEQGAATMLFRPSGDPSPAAQRYIDAGEAMDVHRAYKCRVRSPWWRVPLVRPADLFLTYMNADTPRLCTNRERLHHLNSVHGVYVRAGLKRLAMDLLPLASLNSMTLLGAETVGRAYGGGMLKLEPKEADKLPVPTAALVESARDELAAIRPLVAAKLRQPSGLLDAVKLVDEVVLIGALGISRANVRSVREAHAAMAARRHARGADPRGEN